MKSNEFNVGESVWIERGGLTDLVLIREKGKGVSKASYLDRGAKEFQEKTFPIRHSLMVCVETAAPEK